MGPFANPFAAAAAAKVDAAHAKDDAKKTDAKVSSVSFAEKNKICPEIWTQGIFQMTRHNVGKKTAKYYCRNKRTKDCKCSFAIKFAIKNGIADTSQPVSVNNSSKIIEPLFTID
jgi:hypothetical protein